MSREEKRYLLHLIAFTVGLGLYLFVSLSKVDSAHQIQLASVNSTDRSPASLIASQPTLNPNKNLELVHLDCSLSQKSVSSSSGQIRLAFDKCHKDAPTVVNQTNGSTAILIQTDSGYVTDYLQLSPGENTIEFSSSNSKGSVATQVVTIRFE